MDRARAWTAAALHTLAAFFYALDVDDGYARGMHFLKPPANCLTWTITWVMKRIFPNRPTKGITAQW